MCSFIHIVTTVYFPLIFLYESSSDDNIYEDAMSTFISINKRNLYIVFALYTYTMLQWLLVYTQFISWTFCIYSNLNLLVQIIINICAINYIVCKQDDICFDYIHYSYLCTHLIVLTCIYINFIYKSFIHSHGFICSPALIRLLNGLLLLVTFIMSAECLQDVLYYFHYWIAGCIFGCLNACVVLFFL